MKMAFLVRHADIDLPPVSSDPPLNTTGRARAEALARVLGPAGITAIFTSKFARTKQTVEPLTARSRIQPREEPSTQALADSVLSGPAGAAVLIAGHSNTVPDIIALLGVAPPNVMINEREFDNLFVVPIAADGQTRLIHLKY
jgi:phosphohistidine phosphatase SixA